MKLNHTIMLTLIVLLLSACTAQQNASWGGDYEVAPTPSDVCINEDGTPKILGINIEESGDVALVYITEDGDVVSQHYGGGFWGKGFTTQEQGRIIFDGDGSACPQ